MSGSGGSSLFGTGNTLVGGAVGEPLLPYSSIATWLGVTSDDNVDVVAAAIQAASDAVIDALGWDPRSQSYTEIRDGTGGNALIVRNKYITAVSAVNFLWPSNPEPQLLTNFTWDDAANIIYSLRPFPRRRAFIQVTYTAGFVTVPSPILLAVLYTIKAMIDGSGVDFNGTGESFSGVLARTFNAGGPAVVPPSAHTLMNKWKRTL